MSEDTEKGELNSHKKDIEALLAKIKGQGSFSTEMTSDFSNLKISVGELGELKFPIKTTQAKALIQYAAHAPFGHREQTITDLSVRNAWEIKKSKIKIDSKSWNKTLNPILSQLQDLLGFPPGKIKAKLDKLLIYEKGQFFVSHQDSEKENGMLGSLIVVLPSEHKGGSLVVSHHGEDKTYRVKSKNFAKLNFFAFYSDCKHEIKQVTAGHRITLTYNIIVEPSKDHNIDFRYRNDKLEKSLNSYFSLPIKPPPYESSEVKEERKFVYFLDHQYTPSGLSPFSLKNGDYLKFNALSKIADDLEFNIFVATAKVHECWSCEDDDFYYRKRYKRRYRNWYDDEEEENTSGDYTLGELVDGSITLDNWKSVSGKSLPYGEIAVYDDEIFMTKPTDIFDPYDSEHEGWMGNYGNTLDRWYHRAAIILWPKKKHFNAISGIGPEYVISVTKEALKDSKRDELRDSLALWKGQSDLMGSSGPLGDVLTLAKEVENPKTAEMMLNHFKINALESEHIVKLLEAFELYGKSWSLSLLKSWHRDMNNEEILNSNGYLLDFVRQALDKDKCREGVKLVTQINTDAYIKRCNQDKRL